MTKPVPKTVPITRIVTTDRNYRKTFLQSELDQLTKSIKAVGILQPLVVRSTGHKQPYELIAGERRLRAAGLAGLAEVPVFVVDMTDEEAAVAAMAENEQRVDVPILEVADGYHCMIAEHKWSVKKIAAQVGKSESSIRSLLRLRDLPELSKQAVADGRISMSVAQLIAERPTAELRLRLETYVLGGDEEQTPSVRDVKDFVRRYLSIELKGAPFKLGAKTLVRGAGACTDCPKRVGNMEGADSGRADVCTDPKCYHDKLSAHQDALAKGYEAKGHRVICSEEAAEVFNNFGQVRRDSGYVDLDDPCPLAPTGRSATWGQELEGSVPPAELSIYVTSGGDVKRLVKYDWASAFYKHTHPAPEPAKATPPPERMPIRTIPLQEQIGTSDIDLRAKALETYRRAAHSISAGVYGEMETQVLKLLAWRFIEDGGPDEIEESIRLYHQVPPEAPAKSVPDEPDLDAMSGSDLVRYAAAQLIAHFAFEDFRGVELTRDWFHPSKKEGVK